MLTFVYSVEDKVAEIFFPPFTFKSDEEAIRMFSNCVNTPDHKFEKNPSDYVLHKVGAWDEKMGILLIEKAPLKIAIGSDYVIEPLEQVSMPF